MNIHPEGRGFVACHFVCLNFLQKVPEEKICLLLYLFVETVLKRCPREEVLLPNILFISLNFVEKVPDGRGSVPCNITVCFEKMSERQS